jgi:hypothetical protein
MTNFRRRSSHDSHLQQSPPINSENLRKARFIKAVKTGGRSAAAAAAGGPAWFVQQVQFVHGL